jgi:hypothetical protein
MLESIPKQWLENLVRPLEADPAIDVASGYFEPKPEHGLKSVSGTCVSKPEPHELEQILAMWGSAAF